MLWSSTKLVVDQDGTRLVHDEAAHAILEGGGPHASRNIAASMGEDADRTGPLGGRGSGSVDAESNSLVCGQGD